MANPSQPVKTLVRLVSYIAFLVPGLTLLRLVQNGSIQNPASSLGCSVEDKQRTYHGLLSDGGDGGGEDGTSNRTLTTISKYPTRKKRITYSDLQDAIYNLTKAPDELDPSKKQKNLHTAFERATVVKEATSWFRKRRMCRDSCCVETVAISLEQDDEQFIHDKAGLDLADLMVPAGKQPPDDFFAVTLEPEMLPCMIPGTIITVENHRAMIRKFWDEIRPFIQVPYVFLTTGSDDDSPSRGAPREYIADPLMIKWYGSNPSYPQDSRIFHRNLHEKFETFNLGLSHRHPQENHLRPYMRLTNFSNPFLSKDRWDLTKHKLDFTKDVFIHFGLRRKHRQELWKRLCGNTTTSTDDDNNNESASCNHETNTLSAHKIYADMSHHRFGVSPTGMGYDCYRTYEMLLLGIIPIIEERPGGASRDLFQGLPVIHMVNLRQATRQDIAEVIQNFTVSAEFQQASYQDGWKRLFLKSKRRELLRDTARDVDIVLDEQGKEYYQAFKYTVVDSEAIAECHKSKDCVRHKRRHAGNFEDSMDWIMKWGK